MKNYLAGVLLLAALSATAQTYKPFKVNVSVGYATAFNAGASGGILGAIEPKYGITDNIDLGFRLEVAHVARGIQVNGNTETSDRGLFNSYLLTGNYLFGTNNVRPFLGLGFGFYDIGASGTVSRTIGQTRQDINFVRDTKFGGMIRGGIKAGHFVAALEFNAAPNGGAIVGPITVSHENAYLGIKVGADIGGGRLDMGGRRR
jgi:outer membrane protein X